MLGPRYTVLRLDIGTFLEGLPLKSTHLVSTVAYDMYIQNI